MAKSELATLAQEIRVNIVNCISSLGVGHIGGCLSIADVLAVLYGKHMNVDPKNPKMEGRDRLVCSKGHAGPAVYSVLAEMGYFDKSELATLNQSGTNLPSHCDMNKTLGVDMTAGSLGQGLSCAVGIAIGSKLAKDNATIYCIVGDGESQEGQIWEAAMYAGSHGIDNLIAFTDYNKLQLDGYVKDINDLASLSAKWRAFNWEVFDVIDGNDVEQIDQAITQAKAVIGKPKMVILNTIKGKGVSFVEAAKVGSHSMSVNAEQRAQALAEIRGEI
ncbi:MAG: transketolase [Clostridia bacterium]|nr:transketolase [Clostridia bacterium]